LLPPSPFNFFDFKTLITNAPDKLESIKFLADNFDHEGFSLWHIHYDKCEGEGVKLFLTSNSVGGFLQRLEHFRKYCYGVLGVYGEEPNLEIKGVFMWRGTEKAFEITDHPSYEYHFFRKMDIRVPEDRKLVNEYWTIWDDEGTATVEGLRPRDVRYFK